MMAEVAIGAAGQNEKLMDVQQRPQDPHYGQGRQVGVQIATGFGHQRATVADALDVGLALAQAADQVRAVQIAAWLASGKEDLHATLVVVPGEYSRAAAGDIGRLCLLAATKFWFASFRQRRQARQAASNPHGLAR